MKMYAGVEHTLKLEKQIEISCQLHPAASLYLGQNPPPHPRTVDTQYYREFPAFVGIRTQISQTILIHH
jgi:hypothetical protein